MKDRNTTRIGESLANSVKALASAVKSLYKVMPVMMIVFVSLGIYLSTLLAFNTTWMVCILSFVIVVSSICIYFKSNNYGEAVLSLSAGLFTVYTVSWTFPLFVGFIVVWLLFTLIVFLIASVKLVFCKHFLDKVAKYFWTLLHVQIGQSCKALASHDLTSY